MRFQVTVEWSKHKVSVILRLDLIEREKIRTKKQNGKLKGKKETENKTGKKSEQIKRPHRPHYS